MTTRINVHNVSSFEITPVRGLGDDGDAWQDFYFINKDGDTVYTHTVFSGAIKAFREPTADTHRVAPVNGTTHDALRVEISEPRHLGSEVNNVSRSVRITGRDESTEITFYTNADV